ncbi:replicative DNA helicase [Siccationidurans ginsengisoli]|nr:MULTISPECIES: replicative DNA helicase [unclassified Hymenobacter]MBO2031929.1 replicative DNA helicase [Hymenobacter sp. BT559]
MQPGISSSPSARRFTPTAAVQSSAHLPPQKLTIEAAVLGAAMLEADAARILLSLIQNPKIFYSEKHQAIFTAIALLSEEQRPIDQLTVVDRLRTAGTLERAGGVGYVAGLTMYINGGGHIDGHCRLLQEAFGQRTVIQLGTRVVQLGYDAQRDPLEIVAEAEREIQSFYRAVEQRPPLSVADEFGAMFAQLRLDVEKKGLTGVPTGLTKLNEFTGGWQCGDLIVLAGRPAMGKTAVMLHFARAASLDHHKRTAIFSLEMPRRQLVQRLVATEVPRYTNSDLRQGKVAGGVEEVRQLEQQAERLLRLGGRLLIDDTAGISIAQLRAKCHRLHAEEPLGLILVDYIQLMQGEQKAKSNREQEISSISRGLKELAKELHVPVIALSQLSRSVETRGGTKRPQLSDLRESGAIEQDADAIVFLWRGEYYKIDEYDDGSPTKDTVVLDIAKHRNGDVGEVFAGCQLKHGLIYDFGQGPAEFPKLTGADDAYQPRRIGTSTSSDFEQSPRHPIAKQDLPF